MFFDIFQLLDYLPDSWLPPDPSIVVQGQAGLIILVCLLLIVATGLLLLSWLISRDLQNNTIIISILYVGILSWIASLPRTNNAFGAGVLLIVLLLGTLIFITFHYGVGSPSVAAFLLPIVVATIVVNSTAGFAVTVGSVLFIWAMALFELLGWRTPLLPVERDNLTFKAPLFTVLFVIVFILIGGWSEYLMGNMG